MMKTQLIVIVVCWLISYSINLRAQTCPDNYIQTTPDTNFTILVNGLVEDNTTGLMWMRCAYGQTWDDASATCQGNAVQITWQDALQASVDSNYAGYNDWRLPNVKELASIVERACTDPAANSNLLPQTPADNFWTATTVTDSLTSAWSIAFYNGRNNTKDKLLDLHARFVRYAR